MKNKLFYRGIAVLCAAVILAFTVSYTVSYAKHLKKMRTERSTPVISDNIDTQEGEAPTETAAKPSPLFKVYDLPSLPIPDDKVIYLTFDDGPGQYTEHLLDILKTYNVKATFFVTAMYEPYLDLLTREAAEGHSIGVHSYSHVYKKIYASAAAYWADFDLMQEIIKEKTGSETMIMRFPGGSSNTVSMFNPGIMTTLSKQMDEKGVAFFDWNVLSGDAGETTRSEKVVSNCKEGVSRFKQSVVLCHDVKSFTVDAMETFIPWALENGYTFLPLSPDSFTAHHGVNN